MFVPISFVFFPIFYRMVLFPSIFGIFRLFLGAFLVFYDFFVAFSMFVAIFFWFFFFYFPIVYRMVFFFSLFVVFGCFLGSVFGVFRRFLNVCSKFSVGFSCVLSDCLQIGIFFCHFRLLCLEV